MKTITPHKIYYIDVTWINNKNTKKSVSLSENKLDATVQLWRSNDLVQSANITDVNGGIVRKIK